MNRCLVCCISRYFGTKKDRATIRGKRAVAGEDAVKNRFRKKICPHIQKCGGNPFLHHNGVESCGFV